jgi:hypothetical protein
VPEPRPAHEIAWTTQGYSENQNASALRWGSMYNYWFTADTPPVQGEIELDLFKPGTGCVPQTIRVTALAPAGIDPADIARNGLVDADDLVEVVAGWGPCACPADCDADVDNNGAVDADDLTAVVLGWSTGK